MISFPSDGWEGQTMAEPRLSGLDNSKKAIKLLSTTRWQLSEYIGARMVFGCNWYADPVGWKASFKSLKRLLLQTQTATSIPNELGIDSSMYNCSVQQLLSSILAAVTKIKSLSSDEVLHVKDFWGGYLQWNTCVIVKIG